MVFQNIKEIFWMSINHLRLGGIVRHMCRYWTFKISATGFFLLFCVGGYYQNSLSLTIVLLYTNHYIVSLYIILFNIQMHNLDNFEWDFINISRTAAASVFIHCIFCLYVTDLTLRSSVTRIWNVNELQR